MILYEVAVRTIKDKAVVAVICDKCKKEYRIEDINEFQEIYYIRHACSYASVFEDNTVIECDLCQHCLKKLLDGIYRVIEEE